MFAEDGTKVGDAVRLNSGGDVSWTSPLSVSSPDSELLVVWRAAGLDGNGNTVAALRLTASLEMLYK